MATTTLKSPTRRTRRSAAQWQDLIDRFEQTDQSRASFCREQSVSLGSFNRWWSKLNQPATIVSHLSDEARFVELQSAPVDSSPGWDIELQLGTDVVLRLRRPC